MSAARVQQMPGNTRNFLERLILSFIMRGDEGASGIFRNLAFRSVDLVPFGRLKDGTDGQSVW